MSRSLWRCRNSTCPIRGGAILGRVTADDGLVLDPAVEVFAVYLDSQKATVTCPACGTRREFRGSTVRGC
jgi:hypothetical protein